MPALIEGFLSMKRLGIMQFLLDGMQVYYIVVCVAGGISWTSAFVLTAKLCVNASGEAVRGLVKS